MEFIKAMWTARQISNGWKGNDMKRDQIEDVVDKIFDLLNDGAKDDKIARKTLSNWLTEIYNAGYADAEL